MGLGDKLKDLRQQAQKAVAEHKDQIQTTLETVGTVADQKTKGRYSAKIAKVGEKASSSLEKLGSSETHADTTGGEAADDQPAAAASSIPAEGSPAEPPAATEDPNYEPPSFS
jgi:hypothetical protein